MLGSCTAGQFYGAVSAPLNWTKIWIYQKKKKEKLYQRVTYVAIISQADMSVSGITKGRKEKSQRSRLLIVTKTNNDEELCCYTWAIFYLFIYVFFSVSGLSV